MQDIKTKGLAEEHLAEVVINQLRGWYADKTCVEFSQMSRHRPVGKYSVIISWGNSHGDIAFALVIFSEKLIAMVQAAIDAEDESVYEMYFEKIEDWAVFRAVTQDDGGTFIWDAAEEELTSGFYFR